MAVTSLRLNSNEQKVLKYLKDYFHCDSSTILKKSLMEMYEVLQDKEIIENFEKEESSGKTAFKRFEDFDK